MFIIAFAFMTSTIGLLIASSYDALFRGVGRRLGRPSADREHETH